MDEEAASPAAKLSHGGSKRSRARDTGKKGAHLVSALNRPLNLIFPRQPQSDCHFPVHNIKEMCVLENHLVASVMNENISVSTIEYILTLQSQPRSKSHHLTLSTKFFSLSLRR